MAWNDEAQPVIATAHLTLRPFRVTDGPRVEELAGDRAIADTTAHVPHPYPAGGGAAWIATHARGWAAGDAMVYALALPADDVVIGVVSLAMDRANDAAELGYWLGVPYWNHGYMTEAARALVGLAFRATRLNRIYATYLTRNPASGRVMEKIGMTLEGIERQAIRKWGIYEDVAIRSILRSEWQEARLT